MDLTSTKSVCSSDITQTSSLSAKMKRLQIEESLLLQSINKNSLPKGSQTDGIVPINATNYQTFSEFKAFLGKTKNTFREIKLLYQDIRASTSSKETLKTLDIDEFKKNTLELENRMKAFKMYLQTELTCLKSAEQQSHQIIMNPVTTNYSKRQPRIHTAKYNEIVPSPVKNMMTSPFKCTEVQQFQEFMMNSANRYGGWNEYYHNIFVNLWKKHFGSLTYSSVEGIDNAVESSPGFNLFLFELIPKLQDIREEEIKSHVKWYSKYIYLKGRQQRAIDKWRSNRKVMKSAQTESEMKKEGNTRKKINERKAVYNNIDISNTDELDFIMKDSKAQNQDEARFIRKCYSDNIERGSDMGDDIFSNLQNLSPKDGEDCYAEKLWPFQKPTKQWFLMINCKDERGNKMNTNVNTVENIKKLRVPAWRVGL